MRRTPAPHSPPIALTIAGSDSGGGAGIQADLKTMDAHGVFGTAAITAVTAQHTRGVESTHVVPLAEIDAQIDAVTSDFAIGAAKTGMLATADVVELLTTVADEFEPPLVVDPVMVAAAGDRLLEPAAESAYEALIGRATVATPNADEATILTDIEVSDTESATRAGEALLNTGVAAALIKGGHVVGDEPDRVTDVLVTANDVEAFSHPRIDTEATHGSGCALSASIAARLARGESLRTAVAASVEYMERAVRYHYDVGHGPGAVHHMVDERERAGRAATAAAVSEVVTDLVRADVSSLVPEVGMNVVGATPFAETPRQCAAVEGRITRTMDGVAPNRGVRFGASDHLARYLLAVREYEPTRRFAINVRFDDSIEDALHTLGWETVELDRSEQAAAIAETEGSTMEWAASNAYGDGSPVAVFDRGAVGKEPMCRLTTDSDTALRDRVISLNQAVAD